MQRARLTRYGLLSVTGSDARAFLHAQLTNDIENLPAERSALAGWCSAKGRLLASFLVIPSPQGFLLQVARDLAQPVAKRLAMFVLRSKVNVSQEIVGGAQYRGQAKRRMVHARAPAGVALQPGQDFNGGTVVNVAPSEGGSELLAVLPI